MNSALTIADKRMPVPVADSRFSTYTAPSLVGAVTTGGIFSIRLCSPPIGNEGAKTPLSAVFTEGRPQMKTNTERITQGIHARTSASRLCTTMAAGGLASCALTSLPRSEGERHTFLGCHTRRNSTRLAIDTMAAMMSTSSGPMKFDTRYCGIANDTPVTRMAGQISIIALRPAKAQMSQKGTSSEKNGSWRPIIAVTSIRS
ncbi:hypothetical protein D9M68_548840 [compost metagenome]